MNLFYSSKAAPPSWVLQRNQNDWWFLQVIVAGAESFLSPAELFHGCPGGWQPPEAALWPGPNRKLQISLNKRKSGEAAEGAAPSDGAETGVKLLWTWREEDLPSS